MMDPIDELCLALADAGAEPIRLSVTYDRDYARAARTQEGLAERQVITRRSVTVLSIARSWRALDDQLHGVPSGFPVPHHGALRKRAPESWSTRSPADEVLNESTVATVEIANIPNKLLLPNTVLAGWCITSAHIERSFGASSRLELTLVERAEDRLRRRWSVMSHAERLAYRLDGGAIPEGLRI